MAWSAATAGLVVVLGLAESAAASPERFLYVVNATGRPFHMALDDEPWSPEMSHLIGALRHIEPGRHMLKGQVTGEPSATTTLDLAEAGLITTKSHAFWCVVVGRRQSAELVFQSASQPQCADLIRDM